MTASPRSGARPLTDFGQLTSTIDPDDFKRFKLADSPFGNAAEQGTGHTTGVDALFGTLGILAVFGGIAIALTIRVTPTDRVLILIALLVIVFVGAIIYFRVSGNLRTASTWRRWFRLARFADSNGMRFLAKVTNPKFSGVIFNSGFERAAHDIVVFGENRFAEIGNYSYVRDPRFHRVREVGYLRVQLDRKLPHLVLESNQHRDFLDPKFNASFNRTQTLSLEGDFDKYFTLFAPVEYKRDALYVFTPDLMALLIDEASHLDVEIADDWLHVYSRTAFDMLAPATYEFAERIVATVGTKAVRQTRNYADDKAGSGAPNVIAQRGQRLTQRVPLVVVVVCLIPTIGVVGLLVRLAIWMFGGPGLGR
jgi:hypothetical protein